MKCAASDTLGGELVAQHLTRWTVEVSLPKGQQFSYKYLVKSKQALQFWEVLPSNRTVRFGTRT